MPYTAPSQVDQNGTAMAYGFHASYAPSINGFLARSVASSDAEPEVFVTATNGEGFVEAVAIAKAANKMLKIQITGYVTNAFNKTTVNQTFTGNGGPFGNRFFFVKKISDPIPKGNFVEVTIDCESYPLVTG